MVGRQAYNTELEPPDLVNYRKHRNEKSILEIACPQAHEYEKRQREKERRLGYAEGKNTHRYSFKKRKEPRFLMFSVLYLSMKYEGKLPITRLLRMCGLSWCQYKYYVRFLLQQGFLTETRRFVTGMGKHNGNPNRVTLAITDKGLKYIQLYNGIKSLFNHSDGLNLFGYDSI